MAEKRCIHNLHLYGMYAIFVKPEVDSAVFSTGFYNSGAKILNYTFCSKTVVVLEEKPVLRKLLVNVPLYCAVVLQNYSFPKYFSLFYDLPLMRKIGS